MDSIADEHFTLVGRYALGESNPPRSHPILQFLANPNYAVSQHPFSFATGRLWPGPGAIPEGAPRRAPRVHQSTGATFRVVDVGCSSGANLLLLEEILQRATDKRVEVRGYDAHGAVVKAVHDGIMEYYTRNYAQIPVVEEHIDRCFERTRVDQCGYPNNLHIIVNQTTLLPTEETTRRLRELVHHGDAQALPEDDDSVDATICLFVLRYHDLRTQWNIFKELVRITRPLGYIFLEETTFQKNADGIPLPLNPQDAVAVSFLDARKALWYLNPWYKNDAVTLEVIWPLLVDDPREYR